MAMIKKKAKRAGRTGKGKAKKGGNRSSAPKTKKAVDPAEVRKDIAKIIGLGAKKMTEAVMEEAMKGQVAPTKFLLEVAGVYPPAIDGEQATQEEDCLAKTLLERLNIPKKPAPEEDEEPAETGDGVEEEKPEEKGVAAGSNKADVAATGIENR